jgi:hypothetical protein
MRPTILERESSGVFICMNKLFSPLLTRLRSMERNDKTYWLGLLMLFIGLTWSASVFTALTVVGASMAIESVITSYLAGLINSRDQ